MKNNSIWKVVGVFFTIIISLAILWMLMPFIATAGGIGMWYFTKKKKDEKYQKASILALIVGVIGTITLTQIVLNPKKETVNTMQTAVLSSTSASTTKSGTKSSSRTSISSEEAKKDAGRKKLETDAELAVINSEEYQTRDNTKLAQEAVNKITDGEIKFALQKRIDVVTAAISQKEEDEKRQSEAAAQSEAQYQAEIAAKQKAEREDQAAEEQRQAEAQIAAEQQAAANVYYPNCTAAKNAGAAPVYRGQPGYASHLDRDGDGIGCER